jgi:hypothetical protein
MRRPSPRNHPREQTPAGWRLLAGALGIAILAGPAAAQTPETRDVSSFAARRLAVDPNDTAIPLSDAVLGELNPDSRFSLGLDRAKRENFRALDHKRVLVATSRLALDSEGRHLLESLLAERKPLVRRVILFNDELPAPARSRAVDGVLSLHPEVRVFERTAANFRPTPGMFEDVDAVLLDIPQRGAQYHAEAAFLAAMIEEASLRDLKVIVLDRPIPLDGLLVDGPVGPPTASGTVDSYFPVFPVPGLTTGELAMLYNTRFGLGADLDVIGMLHWPRGSGYRPLLAVHAEKGVDPATDLPEWESYTDPNPDRARWRVVADLAPPTLKPSALADGGGVTLEFTDPAALCAALERFGGIGAACQPAADAGATRLTLSGAAPAEPVGAAVRLWAAAASLDPAILPPPGTAGRFGSPMVFDGLRDGRDPRELERLWKLATPWRELSESRDKVLRYSR